MTKNNIISKMNSTNETVSCKGSASGSPHPKIYLNLLPKGSAKCIYCGIEYIYVKR